MDSEERRFRSLDFLLDYSKGTLWWVHNDIWAKEIPDFQMPKRKSNKKHPGLSLARKKVSGLYSKIPMLIGSSRSCCRAAKCLTVWHMSPEGSPHYDKPGYFSVLRPCGLRFNEFGRADRITMNVVKPRLDRDEAKRLDEMLAGEEVRHG